MSTPAAANPPWLVTGTGTRLVAWREADLRRVERALARIVRDWEQAWGLPPDPAGAHCVAATPASQDAAWRTLCTGGATSAWFVLPPCWRETLGASLWASEPASGTLATTLMHACEHDLLGRWAAALSLARAGHEAPPPPQATAAWSGALVVDLPWAARLLLNLQAAEVLVQRRAAVPDAPARVTATEPPLTRVTQAAAASRVALRAELSPCELDVSTLQGLQVGDVLRIDHSLDAPLTVRDANGRAVFHGFLGRSRGFKAVELAGDAGALPHATDEAMP